MKNFWLAFFMESLMPRYHLLIYVIFLNDLGLRQEFGVVITYSEKKGLKKK